MKKLTCRDIGVDCDVEFHGETDDEIMAQASDHAKREHNLPVIPENIETKCRAAIQDLQTNDNSTGQGGDDTDGDDGDQATEQAA